MAEGTRRTTEKEVVAVADCGVSSSGMLWGFALASSGVGSCSWFFSCWVGFGVVVVVGLELGAAVQRTAVVGVMGSWGLGVERKGLGGRRGRMKEADMADEAWWEGRVKRMAVQF